MGVGEATKKRLHQTRFESDQHEATLALLLAASQLREALDTACQVHGVTRGQYNVLRILRGAHPDGYPRIDIARRMLERSPDVTRLIDRLERRGLIERGGSAEDRRLSIARITRRGLTLLERMQPDVSGVTVRLSLRLSAAESAELTRLCERVLAGFEGETT
jgi:DNA-binding MarR family transcriptional regulator